MPKLLTNKLEGHINEVLMRPCEGSGPAILGRVTRVASPHTVFASSRVCALTYRSDSQTKTQKQVFWMQLKEGTIEEWTPNNFYRFWSLNATNQWVFVISAGLFLRLQENPKNSDMVTVAAHIGEGNTAGQ